MIAILQSCRNAVFVYVIVGRGHRVRMVQGIALQPNHGLRPCENYEHMSAVP